MKFTDSRLQHVVADGQIGVTGVLSMLIKTVVLIATVRRQSIFALLPAGIVFLITSRGYAGYDGWREGA